MIDTWAVMRSLPLVAGVLGQKYGVKVEIGGSEAYTDGSTIHLPAMPQNMPEEMLSFARGYVDHESAHVRETDFAALRQANLSPIEQHIWNSLEDYRVEHKLASVFPGCRQNFNWLIKRVFDAYQPTNAQSPAMVILDWLLLAVRSWDVPSLSVRRDDMARCMDAGFPGMRGMLEPVLRAVRSTCTSTADTLMSAREIVRIIRQFSRVLPEQHENAADTAIAKENPSQQQSMPHKSPTHVGVPNEEAAVQTPQDDLPSKAHGQDSTTGKAQARHALDGLLHASEDDLPQNMGSILAQTLRDVATESQDHSFTVAVATSKSTELLGQGDILEAKQASVALRSRLHGALQTNVLKRSGGARKGRLDTGRLHRIVASDPRVFRTKVERKGLDTAVHILLDCSSSMTNRMHLACTSCYAVASALQASGINIAVTAFPGTQGGSSSYATVSPIVCHGQRIHANMDVMAYGSTPMGESVKQHRNLTHHRRPILTPSGRVYKHLPNGCAWRATSAYWSDVLALSLQLSFPVSMISQ